MDRRSALRIGLALAGGIGCRRDGGPPVGVTDPLTPYAPSPSPSPSPISSSSAPPAEPDAPYPKTEARESIANGDLALHDWSLPGDAKIARRAVVLVPNHLPSKSARVPLLIALHGLAETVDEEMGAYAWVKRYGIGEGYAHLRAPKTITMESLKKMATKERIAELQSELAAKPFSGMVIACPYTPNFWKGNTEAILDAYASWIFEVLVPRLVSETPCFPDAKRIGLDGVSLGGYASLAVGVRKLDRIGALGCVQAAVSTNDAGNWAERIEKAFTKFGARPLNLLTSTQDAFRAPVEALDRALTQRKVPHDFRLLIGPHDQPFLRGPGSLEMLLWQSRALGG